YDKTITFDASEIEPQVSWGTNPGQTVSINDLVPNPDHAKTENDKNEIKHALEYMELEADTPIKDITIEHVFIGSCTNSRLADLEQAASIIKGQKVHPNVRAVVVPGSRSVKVAAEKQGLDKLFLEAGFEWREPGCSSCLGMNDDIIPAGERCASTSNRNFEGRQGNDARTHLVSPEMATAAAIAGHFVDVRTFA